MKLKELVEKQNEEIISKFSLLEKERPRVYDILVEIRKIRLETAEYILVEIIGLTGGDLDGVVEETNKIIAELKEMKP